MDTLCQEAGVESSSHLLVQALENLNGSGKLEDIYRILSRDYKSADQVTEEHLFQACLQCVQRNWISKAPLTDEWTLTPQGLFSTASETNSSAFPSNSNPVPEEVSSTLTSKGSHSSSSSSANTSAPTTPSTKKLNLVQSILKSVFHRFKCNYYPTLKQSGWNFEDFSQSSFLFQPIRMFLHPFLSVNAFVVGSFHEESYDSTNCFSHPELTSSWSLSQPAHVVDEYDGTAKSRELYMILWLDQEWRECPPMAVTKKDLQQLVRFTNQPIKENTCWRGCDCHHQQKPSMPINSPHISLPTCSQPSHLTPSQWMSLSESLRLSCTSILETKFPENFLKRPVWCRFYDPLFTEAAQSTSVILENSIQTSTGNGMNNETVILRKFSSVLEAAARLSLSIFEVQKNCVTGDTSIGSLKFSYVNIDKSAIIALRFGGDVNDGLLRYLSTLTPFSTPSLELAFKSGDKSRCLSLLNSNKEQNERNRRSNRVLWAVSPGGIAVAKFTDPKDASSELRLTESGIRVAAGSGNIYSGLRWLYGVYHGPIDGDSVEASTPPSDVNTSLCIPSRLLMSLIHTRQTPLLDRLLKVYLTSGKPVFNQHANIKWNSVVHELTNTIPMNTLRDSRLACLSVDGVILHVFRDVYSAAVELDLLPSLLIAASSGYLSWYGGFRWSAVRNDLSITNSEISSKTFNPSSLNTTPNNARRRVRPERLLFFAHLPLKPYGSPIYFTDDGTGDGDSSPGKSNDLSKTKTIERSFVVTPPAYNGESTVLPRSRFDCDGLESEGWLTAAGANEFIGLRVRRFFPVYGRADATLVAFLPSYRNDGVPLWHAVHDDNDAEDFDLSELLGHLAAFQCDADSLLPAMRSDIFRGASSANAWASAANTAVQSITKLSFSSELLARWTAAVTTAGSATTCLRLDAFTHSLKTIHLSLNQRSSELLNTASTCKRLWENLPYINAAANNCPIVGFGLMVMELLASQFAASIGGLSYDRLLSVIDRLMWPILVPSLHELLNIIISVFLEKEFILQASSVIKGTPDVDGSIIIRTVTSRFGFNATPLAVSPHLFNEEIVRPQQPTKKRQSGVGVSTLPATVATVGRKRVRDEATVESAPNTATPTVVSTGTAVPSQPTPSTLALAMNSPEYDGPLECFGVDGEKLCWFRSVTEAAERLNIKKNGIRQNCRGLRKSTYRLVFRYTEAPAPPGVGDSKYQDLIRRLSAFIRRVEAGSPISSVHDLDAAELRPAAMSRKARNRQKIEEAFALIPMEDRIFYYTDEPPVNPNIGPRHQADLPPLPTLPPVEAARAAREANGGKIFTSQPVRNMPMREAVRHWFTGTPEYINLAVNTFCSLVDLYMLEPGSILSVNSNLASSHLSSTVDPVTLSAIVANGGSPVPTVGSDYIAPWSSLSPGIRSVCVVQSAELPPIDPTVDIASLDPLLPDTCVLVFDGELLSEYPVEAFVRCYEDELLILTSEAEEKAKKKNVPPVYEFFQLLRQLVDKRCDSQWSTDHTDDYFSLCARWPDQATWPHFRSTTFGKVRSTKDIINFHYHYQRRGCESPSTALAIATLFRCASFIRNEFKLTRVYPVFDGVEGFVSKAIAWRAECSFATVAMKALLDGNGASLVCLTPPEAILEDNEPYDDLLRDTPFSSTTTHTLITTDDSAAKRRKLVS